MPVVGGGQPQAQAQAPQGAGMDYTIRGADGKTYTVPNSHVMSELSRNGYNPVEMSPDGATVKLRDAQGEYEVPLESAIEELGFQVQGVRPSQDSVIYGQESGPLRAAITKLPNDQAIKNFLEQSLQNQGIQGATIRGSGRDWFVYSPQQGKWISMTNNPEWDMTDAVEAGMEIPRFAGAALGGALGAASGLGTAGTTSVPGFLAGTAAGGFAGDALARGALGLFNPQYRSVAEENIGPIIADMAIGSAVDAGTAGALRGAGPLISRSINKGLGRGVQAVTDHGVISPTVAGAGRILEGAGAGVSRGARAVNTPTGRSFASAGVPIVGDMEIGGAILQTPGMAVRAMPKALDKLAGSETLQKYAPHVAEWAGNKSQNLFKSVAPTPSLGTRARNLYGIPRDSNIGPAAPTSESVLSSMAANSSPARQRAASTIGRGIDSLEDFGRGVQGVSQGITNVGLRAAAGAGRASSTVGAGMRNVGQALGPLESRALLRYSPPVAGAEEALNDYSTDAYDYLRKTYDGLQRDRLRRRMGPQ